MTSNLTPEKRMDKTGKLVTRHVRSTPLPTAGRKVPSPSLPATADAGPSKKFKPRPKQLAPYLHPHRVGNFHVHEELVPASQQKASWDGNSFYGFEANDVEVYGVFAATGSAGDTLFLLSQGVKSFEQAKEYLEDKAPHLLVDQRDKIQRALEYNVSSFEFMEQYEMLRPDRRESEHAVDLVRFSISSLNTNENGIIRNSIVDGSIAYDDIQAIGITRLKSHSRLTAVSVALKNVSNEDSDYTVEDIRNLVDRAATELSNPKLLQYAADFLANGGKSCIDKVENINSIVDEHLNYYWSSGEAEGFDYQDRLYERIEYAALMRDKTGNRQRGFSDEFFEAGIPVDKAIDVVAAGGGINEAIAIHHHNAAPSVAGGWL